jgi:hypothetical protein
MKQFTLALLLVAALTLVGCGSNSSSNPANINGTWTATLLDSSNNPQFTLGMSLLSSGSNGSVSVSNFTITSPSPCFGTAQTETGSFSLMGNFNGNMTGSFGMTVNSATPGNSLKLTGTANGNTITGNWTLFGAGCTGTGTFTMTRM